MTCLKPRGLTRHFAVGALASRPLIDSSRPTRLAQSRAVTRPDAPRDPPHARRALHDASPRARPARLHPPAFPLPQPATAGAGLTGPVERRLGPRPWPAAPAGEGTRATCTVA